MTHTVSGAGGGLWDQANVEQGLQGLCFQADQGGSWTNCVCPQEIRDAGGLPGFGGRPCGPARWQDTGATQQRPPNSEAVQPQPAQGGEAWLHSRTSSQLCKLSYFSCHIFLYFCHMLLFFIPLLPLPFNPSSASVMEWDPWLLKCSSPFTIWVQEASLMYGLAPCIEMQLLSGEQFNQITFQP